MVAHLIINKWIINNVLGTCVETFTCVSSLSVFLLWLVFSLFLFLSLISRFDYFSVFFSTWKMHSCQLVCLSLLANNWLCAFVSFVLCFCLLQSWPVVWRQIMGLTRNLKRNWQTRRKNTWKKEGEIEITSNEKA